MAIHRIRRRWSGSYELTTTVYDADGVEATATAGTVTILDSAGSAIVTDGVCSVVDGDLIFDLDHDDAPRLDTYECRWSATVGADTLEIRTAFELVGDYLFEVSDLRTHSDGVFSSPSTYSTARLQDARVWCEQRMENAAGVAFVPRGARELHRGEGSQRIILNHPRVREVYSITEDGTAWTAEQLASVQVKGGVLYLPSSVWARDAQFSVHYEHGHDITPSPVKEAGLILAAEYLLENNLRSRATSESTDVGFIRLAIAAPGGRVGIPEVDAVIRDFGERSVRVG